MSAKLWNTMGIRPWRSARRVAGADDETTTPSTMTRPALGWTRPLTHLTRVDFPEPDRPMMNSCDAATTLRTLTVAQGLSQRANWCKRCRSALRLWTGIGYAVQIMVSIFTRQAILIVMEN